MSEHEFLGIEMVKRLARQVEDCESAYVTMPKPVARAVLSELTRFLSSQGLDEVRRIELIRSLTLENACLHINDLLKMMIEDEPNDLVVEKFKFAIEQIKGLEKEIEIKALGNA